MPMISPRTPAGRNVGSAALRREPPITSISGLGTDRRDTKSSFKMAKEFSIPPLSCSTARSPRNQSTAAGSPPRTSRKSSARARRSLKQNHHQQRGGEDVLTPRGRARAYAATHFLYASPSASQQGTPLESAKTSNNNSILSSSLGTMALNSGLATPVAEPILFAARVYLSYYQWDPRKPAIQELGEFLRAQRLEPFNMPYEEEDLEKSNFLELLSNEMRMADADYVILFVNDFYQRCLSCKDETLRALKELHKKFCLVLTQDDQLQNGWLVELMTHYDAKTASPIELSRKSDFLKAAVLVYSKIQRELKLELPRMPRYDAIKIKHRFNVPNFRPQFIERLEEARLARAIKEICCSERFGVAAVTGCVGVGKSTLVQNLLQKRDSEELLAVDCRIQYIAWLCPSTSLKQCKSRKLIDLIFDTASDTIGELFDGGTVHSVTPRARKVGTMIDDALVDWQHRFLLVIDKTAGQFDHREVLECLLALQSKTLRCLYISENVDEVENSLEYKQYFLSEVRVNDLEKEAIKTAFDRSACLTVQQLPGATESLANLCQGSAKLANIVSNLIKDQSSFENFLCNKQELDYRQMLRNVMESFLENDRDHGHKYLNELYCRLLTFGPDKWFFSADVSVLFDCDESKAEYVCSKWAKQGILVSIGQGRFVMPSWIFEACTDFAASKGYIGRSAEDCLKKVVTVSLLCRALDKRREAFLVHLANEVPPESLDVMCRDQTQNRSKMTFLQRLFNTDWKQRTVRGFRNIANDVLASFLRKLHSAKINTLDILCLTDVSGDNALLQILRSCQPDDELMKLLKEQGALKIAERVDERRFWIEQVKKNANRLLFVAAIRGQLHSVSNLVKGNRAPPNSDDLNAAFLGASASGHADVVRFLKWNGADVNFTDAETGDSALLLAARNGHGDVVSFLCQSGAEISRGNFKGVTPLIAASQRGFEEVVQILLEKGSDVDEKTEEGCSALTVATRLGHTNLVHLLIAEGSDIDAETNDLKTPLWIAAENGVLEIVNYLLSVEAEVDHRDKTGVTPLMAASKFGHVEVMKSLLKRKAGVKLASNDGSTALHAAAAAGHLEAAKLLLGCQADAMAKDRAGFNAFQYACQHGHLEIAELLQSASFDRKDKAEGTSLTLAVANNQFDIVEYLLDRGADVNIPKDGIGITPLIRAVSLGNVKLIRLLLARKANVHLKTKDGTTALIQACTSKLPNALEIVELLHQFGSNLNDRTHNGWTGLMAASLAGCFDIVRWLVANGASVNVRTEGVGATALMAASRAGHLHIVQYLLGNGADLNAKTIQGASAMLLAEACGHEDVARFLMARGALGAKLELFNRSFLMKIDNPQ